MSFPDGGPKVQISKIPATPLDRILEHADSLPDEEEDIYDAVAKFREQYPDNNPKTAIGVTKAPLHLVPPALLHFTAQAFADGAKKYGPYNWRDKTVSSSVYYGAALRHLSAWWDGEDLSQDAQVHHLGHVAACIAILLDGMTVGKLNDDRPTKGASAALQEEYNKKKEM